MKTYVILISVWGFAAYALMNAFYALRSPTRFLRAQWTARRGLSPQTADWEVRSFGVFFALTGTFLAWESIKILTTMFH